MPTESAPESSGRYLSTGPLVWVATISCTTLLLALLRQALWLVVPFLLAIILYYALFPAVRRLTLAGVARETAAALVAGSFFVVATAVMVPTVSWLAGHAVSGEEAFFRYIEAGRGLVAGFAIAFIGIIADRLINAWSARKRARLGLA